MLPFDRVRLGFRLPDTPPAAISASWQGTWSPMSWPSRQGAVCALFPPGSLSSMSSHLSTIPPATSACGRKLAPTIWGEKTAVSASATSLAAGRGSADSTNLASGGQSPSGPAPPSTPNTACASTQSMPGPVGPHRDHSPRAAACCSRPCAGHLPCSPVRASPCRSLEFEARKPKQRLARHSASGSTAVGSGNPVAGI